jgi:hypothetical protein
MLCIALSQVLTVFQVFKLNGICGYTASYDSTGLVQRSLTSEHIKLLFPWKEKFDGGVCIFRLSAYGQSRGKTPNMNKKLRWEIDFHKLHG